MRILYGITKSNFGGAQRYVLELATEAKHAGYEVAVVVGGDGILIDKLRTEGIRVYPVHTLARDLSIFEDAQSFFSILETISKFKPDVFHINSSKMGGIGGVAGRIMRVKKIIFTSHGWAFNEPRPELQKAVIKFFHWVTIMLCHRTICVSEKTQDDVSYFPFIKRKLVVIKNGIKEFELLNRTEAREVLASGISEETLIFGTISELHRIKGLNFLLEAWSKFLQGKKALLVLVGEGEERSNLENLAQKLGISDSVEFRGFVNNARIYLSGFDVFLMPSISENLPYSLLEAGMAGLPVIATRVGGIPEVVENGTSGLIVEPANVKSLYEAMEKVYSSKELRADLGSNLKRTELENFSLAEMVKKTLDIYLL